MFRQVKTAMELLRAAQKFIRAQAQCPPMSGGYVEALSDLSEAADEFSREVGLDEHTFTCDICGKQTAESFDGENDWCVACGDKEFWREFRKQELAYNAAKKDPVLEAAEEWYESEQERLREYADRVKKERLENQDFCEKVSDQCDNMPPSEEK